MKIALVSPAWRRFDVTRLALAERRWLCDELAARGHEATSVIVADDQNLQIAEDFGFHALEMPNDDLGLKFNAGFQWAAEWGADFLVHIGSDDWAHPDSFSIIDETDLTRAQPPDLEALKPGEAVTWREGPRVVTQRLATIVHLGAGVVQRCSVSGRHGVIPWIIPRAAMEGLDFAPIQPGMMRGIDGALAVAMLKGTRPNWHYREGRTDWLVDFKSETNITPFGMLQHNIGIGEPRHMEALAESYPEQLVAEAIALHMTLKPEHDRREAEKAARRETVGQSIRDLAMDYLVVPR